MIAIRAETPVFDKGVSGTATRRAIARGVAVATWATNAGLRDHLLSGGGSGCEQDREQDQGFHSHMFFFVLVVCVSSLKEVR